jgi:hypothetical protein
MDITCWNCKKTYKLDQAGVDSALAAMDTSKLNFYDVPCPNCGKENRTKRADFEAAKQAPVAPAPVAGAEPQLKGFEARKAKEKQKAALEKKKGYKGKVK